MPRLIEFIDPCHVPSLTAGRPSTPYKEGQQVDESLIPADWLKGALEHDFVKVVEPPAPAAEPSASSLDGAGDAAATSETSMVATESAPEPDHDGE